MNLWKKPTKDFFRFCGRFGVFLTLTVGIVLILSASSGTKETVVVAGAGTQSAVVGGGDVGGRNTESLNTACSSSKALISCGKLISSELPKNHQNQFPDNFLHFQAPSKPLKHLAVINDFQTPCLLLLFSVSS